MNKVIIIMSMLHRTYVQRIDWSSRSVERERERVSVCAYSFKDIMGCILHVTCMRHLACSEPAGG